MTIRDRKDPRVLVGVSALAVACVHWDTHSAPAATTTAVWMRLANSWYLKTRWLLLVVVALPLPYSPLLQCRPRCGLDLRTAPFLSSDFHFLLPGIIAPLVEPYRSHSQRAASTGRA